MPISQPSPVPSTPIGKRNETAITNPPPASYTLDTVYIMIGTWRRRRRQGWPGRKGQGRVWNRRAGGGMQRNMYMQIWASLSLRLTFSPDLYHHHHANIPSQTNPTEITRRDERARDTRKAGRGRRGRSPKKASKHLGNGVLYIHPQEGRGGLQCFWLWFQKMEKKTQSHNPPFCFYCHFNSVYCAPVLV